MSSIPSSIRNPRFIGLMVLLVAYTALLFYTGATGDPLAGLLLDLTYVAVVAVFGGRLLRRADGDTLLLAAGSALVLSGLAQAAALAVESPAARLVSDVLLVAGVVAYFYREFFE
jgi:hypothetical protein